MSNPEVIEGEDAPDPGGEIALGPCAPPPPATVDPQAQCEPWTSTGAPFALPGRLAVTYIVDPARPENHELGVLDLRPGSTIRRLTNNDDNESEIDISPDGKKILYTVRPALDAFGASFAVRQIAMDGTGEATFVPQDPQFPYGGGSVWIWPAGTSFLYARNNEGSPAELLTLDLASPTPRPLPMQGGPHQATVQQLLSGEFGDMEVSYDGTMITFKGSVPGDRADQPSIYVFDLRTKHLKRLTKCWSDHDPVFSRDNKKIYFERYYGPGNWFIDDEKLTKGPDGASVDGEGVAIGPWRYQWGIVEVDVETRRERIIVKHDPCGKMSPWLPTVSPSPDGRFLMYTVNDLTAWGDDGKPTRPTGEAWVTDLESPSFARQKVPGSDWVHFIDWTN